MDAVFLSGAGGGQCAVRSQRAWRCRVLRHHPRLRAYTYNNCKERGGWSNLRLYCSRYADLWQHRGPLFSNCHCSVFHWFFLPSTGHTFAEVATVTLYCYTEEQVQLCKGETSLEYCRDIAQEVAEYLSAAREQLRPQRYQEALRNFTTSTAREELSASPPGCSEVPVQAGSSAEDSLRHLEEKITYAVANLDYPWQWKKNDGHPREEGNETASESAALELQSCIVSFTRGNSVPSSTCYWCFLRSSYWILRTTC